VVLVMPVRIDPGGAVGPAGAGIKPPRRKPAVAF
jgi:hypothetical protein